MIVVACSWRKVLRAAARDGLRRNVFPSALAGPIDGGGACGLGAPLCIEAALELTRDNRASAAEMLGLSRQSLYVKLRRYGLGDLDGDDEDGASRSRS